MAGTCLDVEAQPLRLDESDPVADAGGAEIQLAQPARSGPFENLAGLQAGQEDHGVFHPLPQAAPELLPAQELQQGVGGVIDLDEMFEMHGAHSACRRALSRLAAGGPW